MWKYALLIAGGVGAYWYFTQKRTTAPTKPAGNYIPVPIVPCTKVPRFKTVIGWDNEPDRCMDMCTKQYVDDAVCQLE